MIRELKRAVRLSRAVIVAKQQFRAISLLGGPLMNADLGINIILLLKCKFPISFLKMTFLNLNAS